MTRLALLLSLLLLAVGAPAYAADLTADTTTAPAVLTTDNDAAPTSCVAGPAADEATTSLDELLQAPAVEAEAEACFPNECPCPAGFKCRFHCCI